MLLKYFYDKDLAHASYMVGCQRTGEALIIDPARDITPYLAVAASEGMRIVGAADTHIHADYVSGLRELAEQVDAKLYVSDEGDADWKYQFVDQYNHQLLTDGDVFTVGNLSLRTLHTPGHTPESISFLLTDHGGGADKPMGIFTGDFVFVGSVGRPDLLEKAAGLVGTANEGAEQMYDSIQAFKQLPDYLQVWPAHGAGSACGKGLGAIPSSTVGYEKMFSPMLQIEDKQQFIEALLTDQPEPPKYFAEMKRVNKVGPTVLYGQELPPSLPAPELPKRIADGARVVDLRATNLYAEAHAKGSINVPVDKLAHWAGWFVDYDQPIYLIAGQSQLARAMRVLHEIGVDHIAGYFDVENLDACNCSHQRYEVSTPEQLADRILNNEVTLLDVRAKTEWDAGHLPNATHVMLGYLPEKIHEYINGKPIVLQCRSGARSAIAASIAQAAGAKYVINMMGGFRDWSQAGLPVE